MTIRLATASDANTLRNIYAQYIKTPITFEYVLPTNAEFSRRISSILENYPYLVWEEFGTPLGYAYAHRQMDRQAYQWNACLLYTSSTSDPTSAIKKSAIHFTTQYTFCHAVSL